MIHGGCNAAKGLFQYPLYRGYSQNKIFGRKLRQYLNKPFQQVAGFVAIFNRANYLCREGSDASFSTEISHVMLQYSAV